MSHARSHSSWVSCVMIFRDGEAFIGEAIESVLAQTHANWELILVDDGAVDGSGAIARRYARAQPDRIRIIAHAGGRNLGTGPSRNAGVRAARGELVAFLDADDVWLPERLAAHVALLDQHPDAAMAMGPTLFWRSWNPSAAPWWRPWAAIDLPYGSGLDADALLPAPALAAHFLRSGGTGVPGPCSVTIRRTAVTAVGGFDNSFRRLYEDQTLFFKIFLEHPVIVSDLPLDRYRQHEGSLCAAQGRAASDRAARPVFLDWLRNWIEARGIGDPAVHAALATEIARVRSDAAATRPGRSWRRLVDAWNIEARAASVWLLTPRRHNRLRRRLGLAPVAVEIESR